MLLPPNVSAIGRVRECTESRQCHAYVGRGHWRARGFVTWDRAPYLPNLVWRNILGSTKYRPPGHSLAPTESPRPGTAHDTKEKMDTRAMAGSASTREVSAYFCAAPPPRGGCPPPRSRIPANWPAGDFRANSLT